MQNQEGVLKNNDVKNYSARRKINQNLLNDRLSIDLNLNATNIVSERPPIEGVLGSVLSLNPSYPAHDANAELSFFPDATNPLKQLELFSDITNTTRIIGNISPSFEIIKGLT